MQSLEVLFVSFRDKGKAALSKEQISMISRNTGLIWSSVDVLQCIPVEDSEAVAKEIMTNLKLVKDASLELKNMVQEAKDSIQDQKELSEFDADDFTDFTFSKKDVSILDSCLILYSLLFALIKHAYTLTLKTKMDVSKLELIGEEVKKLSAAIDEFGSGLYESLEKIDDKVRHLFDHGQILFKILGLSEADAEFSNLLNLFTKVQLQFGF